MQNLCHPCLAHGQLGELATQLHTHTLIHSFAHSRREFHVHFHSLLLITPCHCPLKAASLWRSLITIHHPLYSIYSIAAFTFCEQNAETLKHQRVTSTF